MGESKPSPESEDARIQAALQDYLQRADRGDVVDREAFLAEHADIAEAWRSFIETSADLAQISGSDPADSSPDANSSVARRDAETMVPRKVQGESAATDSGQLPAQFGRYRVIRPLGSGAMGTVYLADDTQLQRQVALKTPSFDEDDSGEMSPRIVVRMRISGSQGTTGQLFWQTESQPMTSDARYVNFETNPDGEFHEYTIELSDHEQWQGQRIVGLRFDPEFIDAARGATIEIDWIRGG